MDKDTINRLASLHQIDEAKLLSLIKDGKDIHSSLAEMTGLSRSNAKALSYGIMYSVSMKGRRLPNANY